MYGRRDTAGVLALHLCNVFSMNAIDCTSSCISKLRNVSTSGSQAKKEKVRTVNSVLTFCMPTVEMKLFRDFRYNTNNHIFCFFI